jgi:hypothetical protein
MTLLALDLGTKCGWAVSTSIQIQSGVMDFSRSGDSEGMRYVRFEAWLRYLYGQWPDLVIQYERPIRFPGRPTGLGEKYSAILLKFCSENGISAGSLSPSEIKKHATGKGNAKKDVLFKLAQERWPRLNVKDENQSDALWLLSLAMQNLGLVPILNGYEAETPIKTG